MKIIIFIGITALLYYLLISLVIKYSSRKKKDQIVITPSKKKAITNKEKEDTILYAIAGLLSDSDDPMKSAKFIVGTSKSTKAFIMEYLQEFNPKLHDKIMALDGIDLEDIPPFESHIIETSEDFTTYDRGELTKEEDILLGGIAYYKYRNELNFSGVTNYCEYFNSLETDFIARELSDIEIQEIEESKQRILNTKKTSSDIKKIFKAGSKTANSIYDEITSNKDQNNHSFKISKHENKHH